MWVPFFFAHPVCRGINSVFKLWFWLVTVLFFALTVFFWCISDQVHQIGVKFTFWHNQVFIFFFENRHNYLSSDRLPIKIGCIIPDIKQFKKNGLIYGLFEKITFKDGKHIFVFNSLVTSILQLCTLILIIHNLFLIHLQRFPRKLKTFRWDFFRT